MFDCFVFVFGRNMVWSVARGALRFLGFASSRATKIYGDLAKIYGASPQFFATVSGLSFAHRHNVTNAQINVFGIESVESTLSGRSRIESSTLQCAVTSQPVRNRTERVVGKTHPTVRPLWRPL